jgi:class I fructose-bisphosphate aldolase
LVGCMAEQLRHDGIMNILCSFRRPEGRQKLFDSRQLGAVETRWLGSWLERLVHHDALRLGCVGIGFTIYPGSVHRLELYQQIRAYAEEAKRCGLVVVIWSYPRGSGLSKAGETAIDVCGYAAHIAAQLGAHLIKVKLPSAHFEQEAARKVYEQKGISLAKLADRVRHVVQCTFNGRRVVIFSGGPAEAEETLLEEMRGIRDGGGFGSIIGRNSFQRHKPEALRLLDTIMKIYAGEMA